MWCQETRGKEWRGKKNEACTLQSYFLLWRVWSLSSRDLLRNPVESVADDPSGKVEKEALSHKTLLPGVMVSLEAVLIHTNSSRLSQLPALQGEPEAEMKNKKTSQRGIGCLKCSYKLSWHPAALIRTRVCCRAEREPVIFHEFLSCPSLCHSAALANEFWVEDFPCFEIRTVFGTSL